MQGGGEGGGLGSGEGGGEGGGGGGAGGWSVYQVSWGHTVSAITRGTSLPVIESGM